MRVIKISELDEEPVDTATPIPGWTGGQVVRTRQTLIPAGSSESFNSSVVNFKKESSRDKKNEQGRKPHHYLLS